jgi:hypothetical protein
MRKLFLALLVCFSCGTGPTPPAKTQLDLNDVSFLYPLPSVLADKDKLLKVDSEGAQGQLLPRAYFDQMKNIDEELSADDIYAGMRIISARVDPAFPLNAKDKPADTRKQIRLVAQIVEAQDGGVGTRDGTIHLFYNMTDAQFASITDGVSALKDIAKDDTKGLPLDVHPTMKAQGLGGSYAQALNKLITDHCGDQNLFRVAFMISANVGNKWTFGAFLNKSGTLDEDVIPRTDMQKEQTQTENGNETRRNTELDPAPQNDDLVNTLLSATDVELADPMSLDRAVEEALHIENPVNADITKMETPQSVDCASCHLASRALTSARKSQNLDMTKYSADTYAAPSRFDMRRVDQVGENPFAQRAFGYFGSQTAFSQRTINESAVIADTLSPK